MNIPTLIFSIIVAGIIIGLLYIIIKVVIYTAPPLDTRTEQEKVSDAYFHYEREKWHKEQGHTPYSEYISMGKTGYYQNGWRDSAGNDVTYQKRM